MALSRPSGEPGKLPDHCDPSDIEDLGTPTKGYSGTEELSYRFIDCGLVLPSRGTEAPGAKRPPASLALVARNALPVVLGDVAALVDIESRRWGRVVLACRVWAVRRPEEHVWELAQSIRRRKLNHYFTYDNPL
jgi:hypothetical protein